MKRISTLTIDQPKTFVKEDEFRRKNLVDIICNAIWDITRESHPCTCMAVYGKWGEGKTTLLNFVENQLLANGKTDNINIVHFNPWIVTGDEALLREFFSSVVDKTPDDKVKSFLNNYGSALALASKHVLNVVVPSLGERVSEFITEAQIAANTPETPLSEIKKQVVDSLKTSGKQFLIIIDDIDRLDAEEIHLVFRLIRQVADFPNTIYLLAMDPDIVSKSLGRFIGANDNDGRYFLDKIVQIPIKLPVVSSTILEYVLVKKLGRQIGIKDQDDKFIAELAAQLIPLLRTPRQIIRYCNQLSLTLPSLKDEICVQDLCILEAIKMLNPEAYLQIYYNKDALLRVCKTPYPSLISADQIKKVDETFNSIVESIAAMFIPEIRDAVIKSLNLLFSKPTKDRIALVDSKRVTCDIYFPVYFLQAVPEDVIPNSEIESFLNKVSRAKEKNLVSEMNSIVRKYGSSTLQRVCNQSIYRADDANRCKRVSKICKCISLTQIAKQIGKKDAVVDLCPIFIYNLLEKEMISKKDRMKGNLYDDALCSEVIKEVYSDAEMELCMGLNANIILSFSRKDNLQKSCFLPLIGRFKTMSYKGQLEYSSLAFYCILVAWKSIDKEGFNAYIKDTMSSSDCNMGLFISHIVSQAQNTVQGIRDLVALIDNDATISEMISIARKQDKERKYSQMLREIAVNYKIVSENSRGVREKR